MPTSSSTRQGFSLSIYFTCGGVQPDSIKRYTDRECWVFTPCSQGQYALQQLSVDQYGFILKPLICKTYRPCVKDQEYTLLDGSLYGDRDYICAKYTECKNGLEYESKVPLFCHSKSFTWVCHQQAFYLPKSCRPSPLPQTGSARPSPPAIHPSSTSYRKLHPSGTPRYSLRTHPTKIVKHMK